MGLTSKSSGKVLIHDISSTLSSNCYNIALAGNPNVGKSTVFNQLTGLKQHTGNWPGKTVSVAHGTVKGIERKCVITDVPGTYSLVARSPEEEVARDCICFNKLNAVIVVCDATSLKRNLNLLLQICQTGKNVVLCINLVDEARKKGISIDTEKLKKSLGIQVVTCCARKRKTLCDLKKIIDDQSYKKSNISFIYREETQYCINILENALKNTDLKKLDKHWTALRLLENDHSFISALNGYLGYDITEATEIKEAIHSVNNYLTDKKLSIETIRTDITQSIHEKTNELFKSCIISPPDYDRFDRKTDKIVTGRFLSFPIMFLMLAVIFYITISGANYPSSWLNYLFSVSETKLFQFFLSIGIPNILIELLVFGCYRVVTWIVSVMLPPMAIFFPLFTLLEDSGLLPRIAFNLDRCFKACKACGKQALTMCMGFGCNAAGVVGCRIIDSRRERLVAILTNSFVPCNGRFPTLIALITLFFIGSSDQNNLLAALILSALIVLSVIFTMITSVFLSNTMLKGESSSFILELPSYRRPQIGQVIVRSVFDRTIFVLGRAITSAIPAGIILWILANVETGGISLLKTIADFLDPFASAFGLDGIILTAFILGAPANEIVFPIIIMGYCNLSTITEIGNLAAVKEVLISNGWTTATAICTVLFMLMHWPCITTLLTIKKETKSLKWTLIAAALPTLAGLLCCLIVNIISKL